MEIFWFFQAEYFPFFAPKSCRNYDYLEKDFYLRKLAFSANKKTIFLC